MTTKTNGYFISGAVLTVAQPPFLLNEADFLRLKATAPITLSTALSLFGILTAFTITDIIPTIVSKLILNDKTIEISKPKIYTVAIISGITVLIYIIGKFLPNENKKILRRIEKHFTDNPTEVVSRIPEKHSNGENN